MPVGGGDPKVAGDGQVVVIRPEFSRGGSDLWDVKDVVVAAREELDDIRAALAASATYALFQTAVAALPKRFVLLDHVGV